MRYKQRITQTGSKTGEPASAYRNRHVLVTGGLGFIGSSLARRLAQFGARVTVVDSMVPGCGANRHNLADVAHSVRVIVRDICEAPSLAGEIRRADVIFNLAGEISHTHSMRYPERDAAINAAAQLRFLDQCVRTAPGKRIVYASTRQIYGSPRYLPVDEAHPIQPVDFNGIHKYAASAYHLLFSSMGRLDSIVLCLTNVYGPRMALRLPCQGFLGTFVRHALTGKTIEIFGDGRQLRDPVYIDDVLDVFLKAGCVPEAESRVYNVGGPEAFTVARIAEIASAAGGTPAPVFRPFPRERKAIDIGSYATDSGRAARELAWFPSLRFEEGFARTLEYYRGQLANYLDPADPNPECELLLHKRTASAK
jgi:nucleoside-diphosphate-sugar epimerase